MVIAWIPLVIALVGGAVYALVEPTNPTRTRLAELARIAFFVGLFFVAWGLAAGHLRIGP